MAAERRLLEKPRHELVTFDLVHVLLSQRPSSLHAEPAAGTGSRFSVGAVGVVANRSRWFFGGGGGFVVVVVSHVCEQRLQHDQRMLSSAAADCVIAAAAAGECRRRLMGVVDCVLVMLRYIEKYRNIDSISIYRIVSYRPRKYMEIFDIPVSTF